MIVDLEDLKGNGCLICVEDYTMNYIPFFLRIFIRSHFFFGNHMEFLVEWIGDTLTLKDVSQLWIPKMFQTSPLSIQELVYSLARYVMILLMVQKSGEKTTWDVKHEINHQPQLVQDFFHQQYDVYICVY